MGWKGKWVGEWVKGGGEKRGMIGIDVLFVNFTLFICCGFIDRFIGLFGEKLLFFIMNALCYQISYYQIDVIVR